MKYLLSLAVALVLFSGVSSVHAQFTSDVSLSGHAWSSNIGWISLAGPGHEVVVEPDGDVVGYAWSSTVGWIKFGGLSSFPSGGSNASVDLATDEVSGWARACAGTASGDCSSMSNHIDGWDGWISLNCDNTGACGTSNYNLSTAGGSVTGFAWGSDVIGWIGFTNASFTGPCAPAFQCLGDLSGYTQSNQWCAVVNTTSCSAGYVCNTASPGSCIPDAILGSISARPAVSREGETVDVTWSATNATACTLYQQNPGGQVDTSWTGLSGTEASDPITTLTVFSLECTDIAGVATYEVASTTVRVLPNLIES